MPTMLDQILVVLITIVLPLHDLLLWFPRLLRATPATMVRARSRAYAESVGIEWGLVVVLALAWAFQGRSGSDLGLTRPGGWGFWVALGLAAAFAGFSFWQRRKLTGDDSEEVLETVLAQLDKLRPLLPHTRPELGRFVAVSLTAGICEELLYRGFLIWYLRLLVPTVPAVLVAALLFGFAHAYQGAKGVAQTAAVGLGLAILYILSGSLWVPMALHAFVDVNSGILAHDFLRRERESLRDGSSAPWI